MAVRKRRDVVFDGLFGEPGWDVLLALFVAHQEGGRVRVSDACAAAGVPATTALRWLSTLKRVGAIELVADPENDRQSLVTLTPLGIGRMELLLE